MNNNWQQTGIIAPGGTIFSLAFEPGGRLWLLSGAGIFGQNDNASGWRPLSQGQPLAQVNALACAGRFLFAGGTQGEIVYSSDGGQQWYQGQVTQTIGAQQFEKVVADVPVGAMAEILQSIILERIFLDEVEEDSVALGIDDGVADAIDNCINVANADQRDTDDDAGIHVW